MLSVSHCPGSRFCAKICSASYFCQKLVLIFVTEAFKYCFLESYISEWKYYGFECTFERQPLWSERFSLLKLHSKNTKNRQIRRFSIEICVFSALFYCLEVYLASSCHLKRPPEFCIGPRRIILKKSSLCVCGTLPKRAHRIILCRIILP